MGMYDIIENVKVYCPQCGEVITDEFQTKSLPNPILHHYKIGDRLPDDRNHESYIEIHSICHHCKLLTRVYLSVIDDILTDKFE